MEKQDMAKWLCRFRLCKYCEDIASYWGREDEFQRLYTPYELINGEGNCLLNSGIDEIWDLVCGDSANHFNSSTAQIGVGDSATAASATQTDLQASTNKTYKAMDSGYPTSTTQKATFKASFGTSEANYAWNEWVVKQSSNITGFYPDFTVSPNDNGKTVIEKLLSFMPDVIFVEGNKAYLVNPQSTDSTSYGIDHAILEGKYRQGALATNRLQVEGYDSSQGKMIVVDRFDWNEVNRLYDRIKHIDDKNLSTTSYGYQRGDAYLRKAAIAAVAGAVLVPVNCGEQLYDVIEVTDARAGLAAAKRRVLGMTLVYRPQRGEYLMRLELGGV